MPESNLFNDIGNWLYVTIPLVALANVIHTIFTDDILKHYYFGVLLACFGFFLFCCLTALSNVCVLPRKAKAEFKPVLKLRDSDLVSDDETPVIQPSESESGFLRGMRLMRVEFSMFLRSRRIYGLIAKVGALFILSAIVLTIVSFRCDPNVRKDFHISAKILFISGLVLEIVAWAASCAPRSKDVTPTYKLFEESVRIPMMIFVPKVVRHLRKRLSYIGVIVFYQSAAIFALVTVINMPEGEIQRFKDVSKLREIHGVLIMIMTFINMYGLVLLLGCFWTACDLAREDLFIAFEKNWRENLEALDFLLHDKNVLTLEQIRQAFVEKSQNEGLTPEELEVLKYIGTPLWKTKQPFIHKRGLSTKMMRSTSSLIRSMGSSLNLSASSSRDIPPAPLDPGPSSPRLSPPLTRSRARRSSLSREPLQGDVMQPL